MAKRRLIHSQYTIRFGEDNGTKKLSGDYVKHRGVLSLNVKQGTNCFVPEIFLYFSIAGFIVQGFLSCYLVC